MQGVHWDGKREKQMRRYRRVLNAVRICTVQVLVDALEVRFVRRFHPSVDTHIGYVTWFVGNS